MRRWAIAGLQRLDIRFSSPAVERSFKKDVEGRLLNVIMIIAIVFLIGYGVTVFTSLGNVEANEEYPFQWSGEDPRTHYYIVRISQMVANAVLAILAALRRYLECFKSWNWEFMAVAVTSFVLVSQALSMCWHLAKQMGMDPTYVWGVDVSNTELLNCLILDAVLTAASLFAPIRCVALWVLNVSAVVPFAVVLIAVGSPFPADVFTTIFAFSALSLLLSLARLYFFTVFPGGAPPPQDPPI